MILRHLRAVIALSFLALAIAASAAPGISQAATVGSPAPQGRIGIKLLQVPTSEVNDPRALTYIIDHLAPDAVIHREFGIANLGSTGPFSAPTAITIAPGQSYQDTFKLNSSLPNGPWKASFTMVSGLITKTETFTLDFAGGAATAAHSPFPVVPVAGGIAVLILLALAALLITRSRRTGRVRIS